MNHSEQGTGAETRIIGDAVDLDYDSTLSFFERRAERGMSADVAPITVTSYQDDDPELAERRDVAEWARVESFLGLDRRPVALDVGCGVGRWARHLRGRVERYVGIDFSPSLAEMARRTIAGLGWADSASVRVLSAADAETLAGAGPFGLVIVGGVLAYLNDADVVRCLAGIGRIVDETAVVYVREPVGIAERLTLVRHWSDELADEYNAVYRTADQYREWLDSALGSQGFEATLDAPLDSALQNRAQTSQHFFVLRRDR